MINIGINGFNIISKMIIYNIIKKKDKNINIVAINIANEKINIDKFIYILKYDNIYKLSKIIIIKDIKKDKIIINNKFIIKIINENNINNLNWKKYKAKYIIETTYTLNPNIHIKNGANKVILTYPNFDYPIYVFGVNHSNLKKENNIISYASNTTNCLSPILKILHREYKVLECFITILQNSNFSEYDIINNYLNIIPYKSKVNKEIYKVLPEMYKKIKDITFKIPNYIYVSVVDLTIRFKKSTNYEKIKKIIKFYSKNELTGILKYINKDIIYTDILYNKMISIFDAKSSIMLNNNFFKLICWYNNVIGYSNKIIDFIIYIEYNY
ncbi:MAG: type I glyceraldehyde-3-phosphate dehydrogenase [Candidatus Shikimatogenerans bostrichidophilus]|nr:MAG: type I glyceraldehyde-3-phosphate dehydrogenase [Candidatus Shikimatogenerans bostrichidophilus]